MIGFQGLRRSKRAHETPMRSSRRFVALFGGRAADRPGERGGYGGMTGDGMGTGGSVVAIVEAVHGRRNVGGTGHGKARICARNSAGNNKGQPPAGSIIFLAGTQNDGGTQPCFLSLPLSSFVQIIK